LKDIVLYCKSYSKDFLRLKRLLSSIEEFNQGNLPFCISTPQRERALLEEVIGKVGYQWVSDESIVAANPRANMAQYEAMPGSLSQQIVKSEFWRLGLAENYLCLDSDCLFIRPFTAADFLSVDGTPYTVLHQNKELFQIATNRGHHKVERDLRAEADRVQSLFGRVGPRYYCAPAPFIWSARVWESLDRNLLEPSGKTLWDFISPQHPETLIYGEALMKFKAIPLLAIEPLFRAYHYDWEYYLFRRLGETTEKLKQNFMGVLYQSTWEVEMGLGSDKSSLSLMLKRVKRFGRLLESYF
jgi:hypothetical protein